MCTAISYHAHEHYFGRTLDLEYGYEETVTITPRRHPLPFRLAGTMETHHAIIGIATVDRASGYPLYYDAANEHGLAIAALNFPEYAVYLPPHVPDRDCIAPFEIIPWVLGQCTSTAEAETLLKDCAIVEIAFSDTLPLTPLHWMIADKERSIVLEQTADGLRLMENPIGVLTNSPPFPAQMAHFRCFRNLSSETPSLPFAPALNLPPISRGLGAMGLPGDWSSPSRFVRAAFALGNAPVEENEFAAIEQFFHLTDSVSIPRGCVRVGEHFVTTRYTSCSSTAQGIYYWTTYDNRQIRSVELKKSDLRENRTISFPMHSARQIHRFN